MEKVEENATFFSRKLNWFNSKDCPLFWDYVLPYFWCAYVLLLNDGDGNCGFKKVFKLAKWEVKNCWVPELFLQYTWFVEFELQTTYYICISTYYFNIIDNDLISIHREHQVWGFVCVLFWVVVFSCFFYLPGSLSLSSKKCAVPLSASWSSSSPLNFSFFSHVASKNNNPPLDCKMSTGLCIFSRLVLRKEILFGNAASDPEFQKTCAEEWSHTLGKQRQREYSDGVKIPGLSLKSN